MPLVSVIIPCFNGASFVGSAIDSALSQTMDDIEVLVVDDHSTDDSREIIESFRQRDARVRPIYLAENGGVAAARNAAIDVARGQWIAPLDADDLFEPDRLEKLFDIASATQSDFVADNLTVKFFGETLTRGLTFDFLDEKKLTTVDQKFFFRTLWRGSDTYDLGYSKPIMRLGFLNEFGLRYDASFRVGEDIFLYMRSIVRGARFVATSDSFYIYHKRPGSLTTEGLSNIFLLIDIADKFLTEDGSLISRAVRRNVMRKRNRMQRLRNWRTARTMKIDRKLSDLTKFILLHPVAGYDLIREMIRWRRSSR